jgi:hypothetical protein
VSRVSARGHDFRFGFHEGVGMRRSGGPDIKVKYFDVSPLDPGADLRPTEPM